MIVNNLNKKNNNNKIQQRFNYMEDRINLKLK